MSNGANVFAKDDDGASPYSIALAMKKDENGGDIYRALHGYELVPNITAFLGSSLNYICFRN